MTIWTIIPVKPLRLAKSRLAEILTPEERQHFAEAMLRHVLGIVRSVPMVTGTLVISRDTHALSIARDYGAKTVQESGAPELNTALTRAAAIITSWRADALLVLPADLPLLSEYDVRSVCELGMEDNSLVLASDRNDDGTNALLMRPPGIIPFAYGPGSFHRHAIMGRDAGAVIHTFSSQGLVQDIDLPEDLENYHRVVERSNRIDVLPIIRRFMLSTKEI